MKRYLSALLSLVLLCGAVASPASATLLYRHTAATPELLEGYVELSEEPYQLFTSSEEVGLDASYHSVYEDVPVFHVPEGTEVSLTPMAIAEG